MTTTKSGIRVFGKVPETLLAGAEKYAARVDEVNGKGVMFDDEYEVGYKLGFKSSTDYMGAVHSDSARTARELIRYMRDAIPCDCDECVADIKAPEPNA